MASCESISRLSPPWSRESRAVQHDVGKTVIAAVIAAVIVAVNLTEGEAAGGNEVPIAVDRRLAGDVDEPNQGCARCPDGRVGRQDETVDIAEGAQLRAQGREHGACLARTR